MREVAEQGCAIFGVPSDLFSPEFHASFVRGGAPEVDGDEAMAVLEIDGDLETFRIGRRESRIVPQTTSSSTGNRCATRTVRAGLRSSRNDRGAPAGAACR
jgi:hypothetical protein